MCAMWIPMKKGNRGRNTPKRRGRAGAVGVQRRCRLEGLEQRNLMSGIALFEGTLLIEGSLGSDTAYVAEQDGQVFVLLHDGAFNQWNVKSFARDKVAMIGFVGGAGNDYIANNSSVPMLALGGDGNDVLRGGSNVDLLVGGNGSDQLVGGGGDDVLIGQAGNDRLEGGEGNDILAGGAGDDVIEGASGADVGFAGSGNDTVRGGAGDDILFGDAGTDQIHGDGGHDVIVGGEGDDWLYGEDGDDVIWGDKISAAIGGNDVIYGGQGNDLLFGEAGTDFLIGEAGVDQLLGGDGMDWLDGGDGDDQLDGENGVDFLLGLAGNDMLFDSDGLAFRFGGSARDGELTPQLTPAQKSSVAFQNLMPAAWLDVVFSVWELEESIEAEVLAQRARDQFPSYNDFPVAHDWNYATDLYTGGDLGNYAGSLKGKFGAWGDMAFAMTQRLNGGKLGSYPSSQQINALLSVGLDPALYGLA